MKRPTLDERLLSKAVINWETGCWEWTAGKNRDGYGRIVVDKRDRLAHRVAYELIEGPIPVGFQLDHLCRVRHCVNPAHLEPVTARENVLRSENPAAQCARQTHCLRGHPFTAENTATTKQGERRCRACDAQRARDNRRQEGTRERERASSAAYRARNREYLNAAEAVRYARRRAERQLLELEASR